MRPARRKSICATVHFTYYMMARTLFPPASCLPIPQIVPSTCMPGDRHMQHHVVTGTSCVHSRATWIFLTLTAASSADQSASFCSA
jgi:hypothetical protein